MLTEECSSKMYRIMDTGVTNHRDGICNITFICKAQEKLQKKKKKKGGRKIIRGPGYWWIYIVPH